MKQTALPVLRDAMCRRILGAGAIGIRASPIPPARLMQHREGVIQLPFLDHPEDSTVRALFVVVLTRIETLLDVGRRDLLH